MKVALAQYEPDNSTAANLNIIRHICERAGQEGVDLLCFNKHFLGFKKDPDPTAVGKLQELAKEFEVEMLTGLVLDTAKGQSAQSALIARDGVLVDTVPVGEIKPVRTCLGPTLVLSEEQSYSGGADMLAIQLQPTAIVMQVDAISLLELEAIKELAIARSFGQAHLVICVSRVGKHGKETCLGTSLAVLQGEILVEADTDVSELVIFSVDTSKFIDYDELRESVAIPALLKQKYAPTVDHDTEP